MNQYCLSTTTTRDVLTYTFREDGTFQSVEYNIRLTNQVQIDWLKQRLFLTETEFLDYFKTKPGFTIVQLQQHITFDMFWRKYNDPLRSSKKRTQAKWNKMPEADQIKAYYFIDAYLKYKGNAEKKYAETYLNTELWNN